MRYLTYLPDSSSLVRARLSPPRPTVPHADLEHRYLPLYNRGVECKSEVTEPESRRNRHVAYTDPQG